MQGDGDDLAEMLDGNETALANAVGEGTAPASDNTVAEGTDLASVLANQFDAAEGDDDTPNEGTKAEPEGTGDGDSAQDDGAGEGEAKSDDKDASTDATDLAEKDDTQRRYDRSRGTLRTGPWPTARRSGSSTGRRRTSSWSAPRRWRRPTRSARQEIAPLRKVEAEWGQRTCSSTERQSRRP